MISAFKWATNPLSIFLLLVMTSLAFFAFRKRRLAAFMSSAAIGWMVVISSTPIPQWLTKRLEEKYTVLTNVEDQVDSIVYIMVLGAGHTNDDVLPPTQKLSDNSLVRLIEALRLYRLLQGRGKIVTSGAAFSQGETLASIMACSATTLGCDPSDTLQLRKPLNTRDEIMHFRERFGNDQKVIIVTSAMHMDRALLSCNKNGLKAIAAPTNFLVKVGQGDSPYNAKPSFKKIEMMQAAIHEYLGIFIEQL